MKQEPGIRDGLQTVIAADMICVAVGIEDRQDLQSFPANERFKFLGGGSRINDKRLPAVPVPNEVAVRGHPSDLNTQNLKRSQPSGIIVNGGFNRVE